MALDPNIILQARNPEFANPLDMTAKAMTLKQMATQNQAAEQQMAEKRSMKDLFAKNVQTDASGKTSLNRPAVLSDLYRVNPEKAMEYQKMFDQQDLDTLEKHTKAAGTLAWSATPENWTQTRQQALQMNLPNADKLPEQYMPKFVENWKMATLNGKEQLDQRLKERELALKEKDSETKRMEVVGKSNSGEGLPIDRKKVVENLATKNASKISIKNQIDAVMSGWDAMSTDQKIASGRQLLKTLNSTEGADAIGAEEANRLGSKLEFAMGNFTNSNPTQFGRDIDGFKQQALNVSNAIGKAVNSNQQEIDRTLGRKSASETKEWNGVTYKLMGDTWVAQ